MYELKSTSPTGRFGPINHQINQSQATVCMLHCEDQCTKKQFIQFEHDGLQKKVSQLQSATSHEF